jgi:hypothetical protein
VSARKYAAAWASAQPALLFGAKLAAGWMESMKATDTPRHVPATDTGYRPAAVEAKWQSRWAGRHANEPDLDRPARPT